MNTIELFKQNNNLLLYIYKFLDDDGRFEDLKDLAEEGEIDFATVSVVGYKFDEISNLINVNVLYEDDSVENGVGYEEYKISTYDFEKFMKDNGYEE